MGVEASASGEALSLVCPAKVNLALGVGAAQPDGYHPIASWMVAVRFGDVLAIRRAAGPASTFDRRLAHDSPAAFAIDWPLEKDLAFRAHGLIEKLARQPLPVTAELHKRIPPGAGLGGGSSDAAAMLVGLNRLFGLGISPGALRQAAQQLGSDVAFLTAALADGEASAIVTGLGDVIEPAPLTRPVPLVLVLPPFGCPTGQVYRAFDALAGPRVGADAQRVAALAKASPLPPDAPFNDLAQAACHVQPALREALDRVQRAASWPVHVTGSGAAMFLVAASPAHAQELADQIRAATALPAVATQTISE